MEWLDYGKFHGIFTFHSDSIMTILGMDAGLKSSTFTFHSDSIMTTILKEQSNFYKYLHFTLILL